MSSMWPILTGSRQNPVPQAIIVGCGEVFNDHYLPLLLSDGVDLEVVAIVEPNKMRRATAAAALSVPAFEGIQHAREACRPEVALVLTKASERFSVVQSCIALGWDCYCEKPLIAAVDQFAVTSADAESARNLMELARCRGVKVGMNFNYRYLGAECDLYQDSARNVGAIRCVHIVCAAACWPHMLDLALHSWGPVEIIDGWVDPECRGLFARGSAGVRLSIVGSTNWRFQDSLFNIEVIGETGRVRVEDVLWDTTVVFGSEAFVWLRPDRDRMAALRRATGASLEAFLRWRINGVSEGGTIGDGLRQLELDASLPLRGDME